MKQLPKKDPKVKLIFNKVTLITFAFFICLYLFLVGIQCLSSSLKLFTGEFAQSLFLEIKHPFVGLCVGILTTALIQSSSATSSIAIAMVSAGILNLEQVIPIIMGANIGTTVTNSIVSLARIKHYHSFERAFAASIIHDFFNILTTIILFPLELQFHCIEKASLWLYHLLLANSVDLHTSFQSPIKIIIEKGSDQLLNQLSPYPFVYLLISILLIISMLMMIIRILKHSFLQKMKESLDKKVFSSPAKAWSIGALFTFIVQSSSVTTSLAVPLAIDGVLTLEQIYPYTVGANFGTGITTFLAALSLNRIAFVAAIAALIFDIFGSCIIYPMPIIGSIPLWLAQWIAQYSRDYKILPFLYLLLVFIFLPLIIIMF